MALELELKGKVAIISGGSDGMGRAAAERLASEGVKVGICARRKDHLERAAEEIRKATGGEVLAVPADVSPTAGAASTSCSTMPGPPMPMRSRPSTTPPGRPTSTSR
jgi:NAD(P)-dependent dehydrogenase (short-subunit alcohol dehydrogenase family)